MKKETYQTRKQRARETAQNTQLLLSNASISYEELAKLTNYFQIIGKRYGLIKEVRENGII